MIPIDITNYNFYILYNILISNTGIVIKHRRIIKRSHDFINSYNSLNINLNDMNMYVVIEYMYIRITCEY